MLSELTPQQWNTFVLAHGPRSGCFLQSWHWGEFQKAAGYDVTRYVEQNQGDVVGLAQVFHHPLWLFGSYGYLPRGPIVRDQTSIHRLLEQAAQNTVFIRWDAIEDPMSADVPWTLKKTANIQPAHTVLNDLRFSEEELRARLHTKTRYNIGLAQKKDVQIRTTDIHFDDVWPLFSQTAERGAFRLHEKSYYQTMLTHLAQTPSCVFLACAFLKETPIAATIMMDFGLTRTYLHGASSYEHRALMAPTLLHWELMRDAKAHGLHWYDWWGVAPVQAAQHPWEGISRFKRGFGGEEVEYAGTYDVVTKPFSYALYTAARTLRRIM